MRLEIPQLLLALMAFCVGLCYSPGTMAGSPPITGSDLPQLQMQAPEQEKDLQYLGLDGARAFTVGQVDSPFTLIEIVGVYCPYCHAQAPLFNTLYSRILKNPQMNARLKMIAIAAGATSKEVDYMKKLLKIPFPVLHDPDFEIHKALGEPRTPFTVLTSKDNKVLLTYIGVIEDIEGFLLELQKATEQH